MEPENHPLKKKSSSIHLHFWVAKCEFSRVYVFFSILFSVLFQFLQSRCFAFRRTNMARRSAFGAGTAVATALLAAYAGSAL